MFGMENGRRGRGRPRRRWMDEVRETTGLHHLVQPSPATKICDFNI